MHHHSGRPAVWLTPLLVALVSCSGGTEEVRVGAPESSSALATAATPSAASAAPAGAVAPTADADAPDLVPSSSSEVPSADDLPTRPGAPYEIEPFDNLGGPYDAFLDTIPSRCPEGEGPQCLVIVATIVGDDTVPEECEVTSFDYDPVPGPAEVPEEDRKLQRGTRVDVGVACPEPAVDPQDPSGPTSDPQTEPESGTEPEPEPESESGTEPEPAAEPDTQPEPEAEPLPGASEPSAP